MRVESFYLNVQLTVLLLFSTATTTVESLAVLRQQQQQLHDDPEPKTDKQIVLDSNQFQTKMFEKLYLQTNDRMKTVHNILNGNRNFDDMDLSGSSLKSMDFSGCSFYRTNLDNVDMAFAKISGSTFHYASLNNATMNNMIANLADFSRASFTGAVLDSSVLDHTTFDYTDLKQTSCQSCRISKSSFKKAKMEYSNFDSTNLQLADFDGATIDSSSFISANLKSAVFNNTNIDGSVFDKANIEFGKFLNMKITNSTFVSARAANSIFLSTDVLDTNFTLTELKNSTWAENSVEGTSFGHNFLDAADNSGIFLGVPSSLQPWRVVRVPNSLNQILKTFQKISKRQCNLRCVQEGANCVGFTFNNNEENRDQLVCTLYSQIQWDNSNSFNYNSQYSTYKKGYLNLKESKPYSALYNATRYGYTAIAKIMVANGLANINNSTDGPVTALTCTGSRNSVYNSCMSCKNEASSQGIKFWAEKCEMCGPSSSSSCNGLISGNDYYSDSKTTTSLPKYNQYPICWAMQNKHFEIVDMLISNGANINVDCSVEKEWKEYNPKESVTLTLHDLMNKQGYKKSYLDRI